MPPSGSLCRLTQSDLKRDGIGPEEWVSPNKSCNGVSIEPVKTPSDRSTLGRILQPETCTECSAAMEANHPLRSLSELNALPVRGALGHLGAMALHGILMAVAGWAWWRGWWPITILTWPVIAWMDHAVLTRLHEAAHGTLAHRRKFNEIGGILIGTFAFIPLSVYRFVHARHHACLGREGDPEFWPYNLPGSPRWLRMIYAMAELFGGWLLTPVLYSVRTAALWSTIAVSQKRRLVMEWIVLVVGWAVTLAAVHAYQVWDYVIVMHLAPAWLAGTMQTIRMFTEHLGMFGDDIVTMTRTVAYRGVAGRLASQTQLHVEHHAAHHRHARMPYYVLPEATQLVYADRPDGRTFPTHWAAIVDMLPWLVDPKLGPQWHEAEGSPIVRAKV